MEFNCPHPLSLSLSEKGEGSEAVNISLAVIPRVRVTIAEFEAEN